MAHDKVKVRDIEPRDFGFSNYGCYELHCPVCGWNWTYQRPVEVFKRLGKDGETGIHTTVNRDGILLDNDMVGNPSLDRDGMFVHIECERCNMVSLLAIYQHEGKTYFEWWREGSFSLGV